MVLLPEMCPDQDFHKRRHKLVKPRIVIPKVTQMVTF